MLLKAITRAKLVIERGLVYCSKYGLTDWLTECLYYDVWQTADEITMHDIEYNYKCYSLYDKIYRLQYTMHIIESVWVLVQ